MRTGLFAFPDSLFEGIASGAVFTAIAGGCGAVGAWVFRVWRAHREDTVANQDKVTQRYEGYVKTLEDRTKDLVNQLNEANERYDRDVRDIESKLTKQLVVAESLRGELRLSQAAVMQLRAGLAPLAVADIQYTVIYADQDCNILEVTPLVTLLFHYFARELIGRNIKAIIPERYHAAHDAGIRRAVETGKLNLDGRSMPIWALTKEGVEVPINLALSGWLSKGRWTFCATITSRPDDGAADPFVARPLVRPPLPAPEPAVVRTPVPVVVVPSVPPPTITGLSPRSDVTPGTG